MDHTCENMPRIIHPDRKTEYLVRVGTNNHSQWVITPPQDISSDFPYWGAAITYCPWCGIELEGLRD